MSDIFERIGPDLEALDCATEARHALTILSRGSSADEQLRIYSSARASGSGHQRALKEVVHWLQRETAPWPEVRSETKLSLIDGDRDHQPVTVDESDIDCIKKVS